MRPTTERAFQRRYRGMKAFAAMLRSKSLFVAVEAGRNDQGFFCSIDTDELSARSDRQTTMTAAIDHALSHLAEQADKYEAHAAELMDDA